MTDLERAHAFIQNHLDCQDAVCTFAAGCGCAAQLSDLVAAARREGFEEAVKAYIGVCQQVREDGAAEMRERALDAARDGVRVAFNERRDQEFIEEHDVIACIEDAFASSIPLTPEGPV